LVPFFIKEERDLFRWGTEQNQGMRVGWKLKGVVKMFRVMIYNNQYLFNVECPCLRQAGTLDIN